MDEKNFSMREVVKHKYENGDIESNIPNKKNKKSSKTPNIVKKGGKKYMVKVVGGVKHMVLIN